MTAAKSCYMDGASLMGRVHAIVPGCAAREGRS
jgi:hypothetical protein